MPGFLGEIENAQHAVQIADEIGYPVMIKASAGGGGKGMRIANSREEVAEGLRPREVGSEILVRRRPRLHREVHRQSAPHRNPGARRQARQRHLSGRARMLDPAPQPEGHRGSAVAAARREDAPQDGRAGRRAGQGGGLRFSAGTVEFVAGQDKSFYFLEMNTRLQVEHPVTELDHRHRPRRADDPRRRGRDAGARSRTMCKLSGWAVESRIYAEDPTRNFLPSIGPPREVSPAGRRPARRRHRAQRHRRLRGRRNLDVLRSDDRQARDARGDRASAIDAQARALDAFVIDGIRHNIPFLSSLMQHPRWRWGIFRPASSRRNIPTASRRCRRRARRPMCSRASRPRSTMSTTSASASSPARCARRRR